MSHNRLLNKLMSFGVDGYLCRWIRSFHRDCLIVIVLNPIESTAAYINADVPLSNILRLTLFAVLINDLSKLFPVISLCLLMILPCLLLLTVTKITINWTNLLCEDLRNVED